MSVWAKSAWHYFTVHRQTKWNTKGKIAGDSLLYFKSEIEETFPEINLEVVVFDRKYYLCKCEFITVKGEQFRGKIGYIDPF